MRSVTGGRRALAAAVVLAIVGSGIGLTVAALAGAPPNVTTEDFDTLRTGWDPNEPALAPATVQASTFGKVFSRKVKGSVYAQPLVVNGTLIVTTEKAKAYGINPTTGVIEWTRSFGTPFLASEIGCGDLTPDLGSTSTPVADPATGVVYMTTRTQKPGTTGIAHSRWQLQAFAASTGQEVSGFPVQIQGTPDDTPGIPFNGNYAMQRPGLLLLNGVVYMGFASDCDDTPYRGIVAGVSTQTHTITDMWSDESGVGADQNSMAGIWQSGGGLVSDGSNQIVFATGNGLTAGVAPGKTPPDTFSESVVQLTVGSNGKLTPTDYFSPADAGDLDAADTDFGSGGPVALPPADFGTPAHPNLLVQEGKDGRIFLLDGNNLGGREQGPGQTDDVLQTLGPFNGVWGHPAAYGGEGGWVYIVESAGGGNLRALSYGLNGSGVPQLTSSGTSTQTFGYTSGSPIVTSNGTTAGSAVVWAVYSSGSSGTGAQLRAYSAVPSAGVLSLLWSIPIGTASKFSTPTSYNGRVYVGTRDGHVIAFGSSAAAPLQAPAANFGHVPVGSSRTVTVPVTAGRDLTVTGVSAASGVVNVPGRTGAVAANLPPGAESSSPLPGTAPVGRGTFSVSIRTGAVRAGATVPLRVTFRPHGAGPVVGDVVVRTSAGPRTVTLMGYGTAPGLVLSPQPVSFGTVDTGAGGRTLTVSVTNSWDRTERLTGFRLPTAPFVVGELPRVGTRLRPQQSVVISVHYDPAAAGSAVQSLVVSSDHGSVTVPLTGAAATGAAHMVISPPRLDFGSVAVGASRTLTFDVTNTGNIPLVIERAAAPAGAFSAVAPMSEGIDLDPGGTLHQQVRFRPATPGAATGVYRLNANDGRGWVNVVLTGTGTG
jgi:hypothetical protein